jgi:transposase
MSTSDDAKVQALKDSGSLNPHPERVQEPLFAPPNSFFDPHDLVQVKYEMLRLVFVEKLPVSEAAQRFGFSRPTFYILQEAFQKEGLAGLLPKKRGPHGAHKLTQEVLDYIDQLREKDESLRASDLQIELEDRFGFDIHPRTLERVLRPVKKKRR